MKPQTFLFLSSDDLPVQILNMLKKKSPDVPIMEIPDLPKVHVLWCDLVSSHGNYFHVEVPSQVQGRKTFAAQIMIPHAAVLMAVQSDEKKEIYGFSSSRKS